MASTDSATRLAIRAELDVPGETTRQWRVLWVWLGCLALAVVLAALKKPDLPSSRYDTPEHQAEVARWRAERLRIALVVGLALPLALTWYITYRRRRGGPHAQGIVVDVTERGELRLWGRGYGQRVYLPGAHVEERLVNVFSGRLGAWRQRRVRIRAGRAAPGTRVGELELATVAEDSDLDLDLRVEGGEGDCVELTRVDYLRVVALARSLAEQSGEDA